MNTVDDSYKTHFENSTKGVLYPNETLWRRAKKNKKKFLFYVPIYYNSIINIHFKLLFYFCILLIIY